MISRTLAAGFAGPDFGERFEFCGELFGVDDVRVEVTADPLGEFAMTFVLGIPDGVEELGIAPGATAVFGRTAAAGFDQARIDECPVPGRGGARS